MTGTGTGKGKAAAGRGLRVLEARVRADLEFTAYPRAAWLTPRTRDRRRVTDVVIVGGGQAGLTIAFALKRRAITNTLILDASPEGSEGPWTTYGRMRTLRTPKHLTGPDQGVPSLTPEAWYRAAYGDAAWEGLRFIPRQRWQEYLRWFRRMTAPDVRNETRVISVRPSGDGDLIEVGYADGGHGTSGTVLARRAVLATGMDGNGEWAVPPVISGALPADRYIHTGAPADFRRFAGQRVGVLGGGASAFDYAGEALEAGAASVDLFYRRAEVPRVNPFRWMEFYAYGAHYPDLPDDDKWRFTVQFQRTNQPPPQQSWHRCARWENFSWHTAAGWERVAMDGGTIAVMSGAGEYRFDSVIAATGPSVNLAARPELADLAPLVARWRDRYAPPAGWEAPELGEYPYLDGGFEFTERSPGAAPWIGRVHDFTYGARLSMGLNGNMNSGLGAGGRRLADALSRSLFLEDRHDLFESYRSYDVPELTDLARPDTVRS